MARNPFGVHFIPTHQGQQHYDFIRAAKPGVVKLVSGNGAPDVQMMATMYECAPDAIHVYRNHPMSEEHDALWRDPVATAIHHVSTWQNDLRVRRDEAARRGLQLPPQEQTMTLGINEPVIELFARREDMSNYDEWIAMMQVRTPLLDDYMSTYVWESLKYGQPCGIGNLPGGQPANLKPGGYATYDWFPKTRRALEANRGKASLVVHEYHDIQGPGEMVDWWTYRWMHCDWDTDIYVLEYGVDRQIRSKSYSGNRGWLGHMDAHTRAAMTLEYIRHCQTDPRFRCATDFTLDGDKIWESFWIDSAMSEFLRVSEQLQVDGVPAGQPHTTFIPVVTQPGPDTPTAADPEPQPPQYPAEFMRAINWLLPIEGGYTDNDEGAPANYGINQAANPDIDVAHLTRDGAIAIYYERYWLAAGCQTEDWPLCFLMFDSAVQHGVGRTNLIEQEAWRLKKLYEGGDADSLAFMGARLQFYAQINEDSWQRNGRAWMRRMGLLLTEAAKA